MVDFVRRVCGGVADTHAEILKGDRYGYRASAVCGQNPPQPSPQGEGAVRRVGLAPPSHNRRHAPDGAPRRTL